MKKVIAFPFKLVAMTLMTLSLVISAIGGVILNGTKETSKKLSNLSDTLGKLSF